MAGSRSVPGIFDFGFKAGGAGIRKGMMLVHGADNTKVVKAATARQGKFRGIAMDEGALPDGAADSTLPDVVNGQHAGIAQVLGAASEAFTAGDQMVCDANARFVKRTPYSISAFVIGEADETKTIGAQPAYIGAVLMPHYVEVIRQVSFGSMDTHGANTRYAGAPGVALNSAQIAIYRARFANEVVRNLSINLVTAPGGSDTVAVTIQKSTDNGATWSDLAVTATISAAGKSATDLVNTATLAAGDLLAVKAVSSGTTAAKLSGTFDVT